MGRTTCAHWRSCRSTSCARRMVVLPRLRLAHDYGRRLDEDRGRHLLSEVASADRTFSRRRFEARAVSIETTGGNNVGGAGRERLRGWTPEAIARFAPATTSLRGRRLLDPRKMVREVG
jgi:hypothetical protein